MTEEQAFLKPFAEHNIGGKWKYELLNTQEHFYFLLEIYRDGIYEQQSKSYYGSGKILCTGTTSTETCGDEVLNTQFYTSTLIVKWRLQFVDNKACFNWYFEEVDYDAKAYCFSPIELSKDTKVYSTRWIPRYASYPIFPEPDDTRATKL